MTEVEPEAAGAELDDPLLPPAGADVFVPPPLLPPQAASITIAAAVAGPANHPMRISFSIQGGCDARAAARPAAGRGLRFPLRAARTNTISVHLPSRNARPLRSTTVKVVRTIRSGSDRIWSGG